MNENFTFHGSEFTNTLRLHMDLLFSHLQIVCLGMKIPVFLYQKPSKKTVGELKVHQWGVAFCSAAATLHSPAGEHSRGPVW